MKKMKETMGKPINITSNLDKFTSQAVEFTNTYKAHINDHPSLREAAVLKTQFPALMGEIEEGDLFAGGQADYRMAYVGSIWWAVKPDERGPTKQGGYAFDFDALSRYGKDDPEYSVIEELKDFWREECTTAKAFALYDKTDRAYLNSGGQVGGGNGCGFCLALDMDKLITLGLPGLRELVKSAENEKRAQGQGVEFYTALESTLDTVDSVFAHYEAQSLSMADSVAGSDKIRLEKIAENLKLNRIRAPKHFYEALQLYWLYLLISGGKHLENQGLDVAMGDILAADIDGGYITEEESIELVHGLWKMYTKHGDPAVCRITLGGRGRRNDKNADRFVMTAMEATRRHHERIPQLTYRFESTSDPALMTKAFDVLGEGCVFPMLYNDDVNIPGVMKALRVPEEDAVRYHPLGCGEYMLAGANPSLLNFGWSVPKTLEAAIYGGKDSRGRIMGPECTPLSDESTYSDLMDNLQFQIDASAQICGRGHAINNSVIGSEMGYLLGSLLTDDCIARGKSMMDGGVRYDGSCIMAHGFTNTADALYAMKELVFDKKLFTLSELLEALEADFEGHGDILKKLKNQPKYGNDHEGVDSTLVDLWNRMNSACDRAGQDNGISYLVVSSVNPGGYQMGEECGACADGRKAGEPFAIGNAPTAGNDINGLTALFNSLSKVDAACGGSASNIKLAKSLFKENREKLESLFKVYWMKGGLQASVSVVDQQDLIDAVDHPEKYPHLLVRLGGWTARFIELEKEQQQDIINRAIY
jgi:pyruvate-formate lyase